MMWTDEGEKNLREQALGSLRRTFGEPTESRADGEYWVVARQPGGRGGFNVHLNSPANPNGAEVFVLAGPHRIYKVSAKDEEDLRLGLRVVEMIVRP